MLSTSQQISIFMALFESFFMLLHFLSCTKNLLFAKIAQIRQHKFFFIFFLVAIISRLLQLLRRFLREISFFYETVSRRLITPLTNTGSLASASAKQFSVPAAPKENEH